MAAKGKLYNWDEREWFIFHCPGCKGAHQVPVGRQQKSRVWQFNYNLERPTIIPSLLIRHSITCCHVIVTDGEAQFCADSTHELASKKVALPDWNSTEI